MDLCFSKLQTHAKIGRMIDMSDWTNALTFDVVGELAYGQKLGQLRTESDLGNVRKTIKDSFRLAANVGYLWGQMNLFTNPLAQIIARTTGGSNRIIDFLEWSKRRVQARRTGEDVTDREDMLAHFLRMKSSTGTGSASDAEILLEAVNIVYVPRQARGIYLTTRQWGRCRYNIYRHAELLILPGKIP